MFIPIQAIHLFISSVKQNLIIGALLAIVVLLFFLKSIKTTLIIALSIPISTITSFIIFDLMGRTLNLISLAGISFAVGMADNSLVVLENIFSKLEKGEKILLLHLLMEQKRLVVLYWLVH